MNLLINFKDPHIKPVDSVADIFGFVSIKPGVNQKGTLIKDAKRWLFGGDIAAQECVRELELLDGEPEPLRSKKQKNALRKMFYIKTGAHLSDEVLSVCDQSLMTSVMRNITEAASLVDPKGIQVMLTANKSLGISFKRDETDAIIADFGISGFHYQVADYSGSAGVKNIKVHIPGEFHILYRINQKTGEFAPAGYYITDPKLEKLFQEDILKTAPPAEQSKLPKELVKRLSAPSPEAIKPIVKKPGRFSRFCGKVSGVFSNFGSGIRGFGSRLFGRSSPVKAVAQQSSSPVKPTTRGASVPQETYKKLSPSKPSSTVDPKGLTTPRAAPPKKTFGASLRSAFLIKGRGAPASNKSARKAPDPKNDSTLTMGTG